MIVHSPEGLSPLINPAANAEVEALFTDITQPQAPLEHRLSPEELERYGLESPPPPAPTEPFFCLLPGSENKLPDLQFTVGSDELVDKIRARNAQQEVLTNPTVIPTVMPPEPIFPPTSTPPPKQQEKPTTEVEVQAVAEVPKKQELPSWAKELFYLEIPKWGIDITTLPKAERTKVKIDSSTRYFVGSNPSDTINKFQETGRYLQAWGFEQSKNGVGMYYVSPLQIEGDINIWFPDATPAEKTALKLRYMGISTTIMNAFDDVDTNIYIAVKNALYIGQYGDDIEALWVETPGTMKSGTQFITKVVKVLSIPVAPLPSPTSTPVK